MGETSKHTRDGTTWITGICAHIVTQRQFVFGGVWEPGPQLWFSLFREELKTPLQIAACVNSGGWEFHGGWGFRVNKQCGGLRGWRGPGVRPRLLLLEIQALYIEENRGVARERLACQLWHTHTHILLSRRSEADKHLLIFLSNRRTESRVV